MEVIVGQRFQVRLRWFAMVVAGVLLLAIPAGVGIYLLRRPASTTTIGSNVNGSSAIIANSTTAVSEEVFASVLDRPGDDIDDPSVDTIETGKLSSRIKVLLGETPIAIDNGEPLFLTDDVQVEIFVAPYPPTSFEVDVDFYFTTAAGEPITGANVDVMYDMLYMDHGPLEALPTELGNGHYLASYDLYMFGPWVLDTYISVPERNLSISMPVSIYVWPE